MNGPAHFQEAEQLLVSAAATFADGRVIEADQLALRAQVHATLALAAATALSGVISNNVTPGSPVNEIAHEQETWVAVREWHSVAAQAGGGDQ